MKQLQKVVYQMECIFGIDISKHTANVAVLIDRQVIKEFKLSSNREGFERLEDELNSFRNQRLYLNQQESTHDRGAHFFIVTVGCILR
ncbi:hypothetical protein RNZ42_08240 [Lacticaseibacillus paracasei]|nr:hypothetical protein RNZ42_08240 [Lacticaseibacillus paracasei]